VTMSSNSLYRATPSGSNMATIGSHESLLANAVALPDELTDGDFIHGDFICVPVNTSGTAKSLLVSVHFNGQLVMSWPFTISNNTAPTVAGRFGFTVGGFGGGSIQSNGSSLAALTRQHNGVAASAATPNTLDLCVYLNGPAHSGWYVDGGGTLLWFEAGTPIDG
jgi:hypothetical protein